MDKFREPRHEKRFLLHIRTSKSLIHAVWSGTALYDINIMGYSSCITKTCLYNFDPLKPHFYIVKLGFTRLYISFRISAQNIDCGYTLEPPRRGSSNEYLYSMFNEYLHSMFIWKFFGGKFSVYLNRHVFVMVAYVDVEGKPYQTSLLAFVIRTFFECTVPLYFSHANN